MGKKKCWMCDRNQYAVLDKNDAPVDRLLDECHEYYVIVPRNPHVWCHIMVVLKKHCEGLVEAQKKDLETLIEPVHKWTKIISQGLKCDRVYLACLCDSPRRQRHLHYHLLPVQKKEKVYFGHGFQWLGLHEYQSGLKPFDKCRNYEKKDREEYIKSMVKFLKEEKAKKYEVV